MEQPVHRAIGAGDVTVEARGNEQDDLGHFLLPQIEFFAGSLAVSFLGIILQCCDLHTDHSPNGRFAQEVHLKIKKYFLMIAFIAVSIIALLYGVSPRWFAQTFLNMPEMPLDFAHILRAVMCLYLALGLFWLFSAFSDKYRNAAVLTTVIFSGGLVTGRLVSLFIDGQPSTILLVYLALELGLVPIGLWVFRLPE